MVSRPLAGTPPTEERTTSAFHDHQDLIFFLDDQGAHEVAALLLVLADLDPEAAAALEAVFLHSYQLGKALQHRGAMIVAADDFLFHQVVQYIQHFVRLLNELLGLLFGHNCHGIVPPFTTSERLYVIFNLLLFSVGQILAPQRGKILGNIVKAELFQLAL